MERPKVKGVSQRETVLALNAFISTGLKIHRV